MRTLLFAALFALPLSAETPDSAIRAVLDHQVAAWNRGDIRAFMEGYDNSENTLFIGTNVVRGYQRVLDNYIARYANRDQMGRLTFSDIEIRLLGDRHALVLGRFHLDRTAAGGGPASGIFTLTFSRKGADWKIVADHTSADAVSQ